MYIKRNILNILTAQYMFTNLEYGLLKRCKCSGRRTVVMIKTRTNRVPTDPCQE